MKKSSYSTVAVLIFLGLAAIVGAGILLGRIADKIAQFFFRS